MYRFLFGAIALVAACGGDKVDDLDDAFDGPCQQWCEKRNECDPDVDIDECRQECLDNSGDCQADEREQALDDLEQCAENECDELTACSIGAGLQCQFGI